MGTITRLLHDIGEGRDGAESQLYDHVYPDLKEIARSQLRGRRFGALSATALVSAAYERLAAKEKLEANDRRHLYYLLSRAMHDVIVETARFDLAAKRGGGVKPSTFIEISIDDGRQRVEILDLDDAMRELRQSFPNAHRMIMLRFYGGLTLQEAADDMGVTFAIARGQWEFAKAWLHERLSREGGSKH